MKNKNTFLSFNLEINEETKFHETSKLEILLVFISDACRKKNKFINQNIKFSISLLLRILKSRLS